MPAGKVYQFPLNTPEGVAIVGVPYEDFKKCTCGCADFRQVYHVTWVKPEGIIGAQPICFKADVYLCDDCGRELLQDDKAIKDE